MSSSTSVKHQLRHISPSTSLTSSIVDPSGPLTPDSVVIVNPFIDSISPSTRLLGDYELSETKLDDFKCARHIPSGENVLYKEYPLESIRQRLEPYQRVTALLLASDQNRRERRSTSLTQLAAKSNFHFFRDILSIDRTAIVIYPNYEGNLHSHITSKHRLTENEAKHFFAQIVRVIQLCHHVGLIVRDLKLRKLVFSNSSQSHLLLTGLEDAIMLSSPTTSDDFVASRFSCPVYACPEIVLNRQMYSGKMADSWSLGIILYTMLFGRYPFCDRTLVGLFMKIGRCRPDIPRTISLKARSLLRSLIRMKPHERLPVRDILGHIWFNGDRETISSSLTGTTNGSSTTLDHSNSHEKQTTNDDAVVPNFECE